LRLAIERILIKAGYSVTAVGDGQEDLCRARIVRPEIILLDMMLPMIEGTEVLRQLKKDPCTRSIPVIVLSGEHDAIRHADLSHELGDDAKEVLHPRSAGGLQHAGKLSGQDPGPT
jgi:CheY-like chemotaxis protein